MEHARRVRIIKGGRAGREAEQAREAGAKTDGGRPDSRAATREVRDVVSDWVRDHRQRADEFRRNYSTLLGEMGFKSPHSCGRVA
jgi:hypothetical protein